MCINFRELAEALFQYGIEFYQKENCKNFKYKYQEYLVPWCDLESYDQPIAYWKQFGMPPMTIVDIFEVIGNYYKSTFYVDNLDSSIKAILSRGIKESFERLDNNLLPFYWLKNPKGFIEIEIPRFIYDEYVDAPGLSIEHACRRLEVMERDLMAYRDSAYMKYSGTDLLTKAQDIHGKGNIKYHIAPCDTCIKLLKEAMTWPPILERVTENEYDRIDLLTTLKQ